MKINLKNLRELTDGILNGWIDFAVGFFALGGFAMGGVSFLFVLLKDLEIDKESFRVFYNLIFGSMRFLIGGLIILFIIKLGLFIGQKIREQDQERREELLKIIREEIKAKKKK